MLAIKMPTVKAFVTLLLAIWIAATVVNSAHFIPFVGEHAVELLVFNLKVDHDVGKRDKSVLDADF